MLPLEAAKLAFDTAASNAWWAMTVPSIKAMRMLGMAKPQPLPNVDMSGKQVVVTGGSRGVGSRTVFHLAKLGAQVMMGDRDIDQANCTKQELVNELRECGVSDPESKIKVCKLDLTDMDSVRSFAHACKEAFGDHMDVLINNAALIEPGLTEQGFSKTFTANYLGHYLLTCCLYDNFKNTPNARIINVSDVMHHYGHTDWEAAAAGKRGESSLLDTFLNVYADSKLAMILFTKELRKRFAADGSTATAFAVHPGQCYTDRWAGVPKPVRAVMYAYMNIAYLSPDQGCHTTVTAACASLDSLRTADGHLALYLQPYGGIQTNNKLPVADRVVQSLGPFAGTVIGTATLPDNVDVECARLWEFSSAMTSTSAGAPSTTTTAKKGGEAVEQPLRY